MQEGGIKIIHSAVRNRGYYQITTEASIVAAVSNRGN